MDAKFTKRKDIGGNKTVRLLRKDYERWELLKNKYNVPDAVRLAISRLFDEMEQESDGGRSELEAG